MKATPTKTSRYERKVDGLFGRVERFDLVHENRVQVQIGSAYFVSTRVYPTPEAARKAAKRIEASHDR